MRNSTRDSYADLRKTRSNSSTRWSRKKKRVNSIFRFHSKKGEHNLLVLELEKKIRWKTCRWILLLVSVRVCVHSQIENILSLSSFFKQTFTPFSNRSDSAAFPYKTNKWRVNSHYSCNSARTQVLLPS